MPPSKKKKRCKQGKATAEKSNQTNGNSSPRSVAAAPYDGDGYDPFLDEAVINIDDFELPPREECPICCLPFPFEKDRARQLYCCGKFLCRACLEDSYYSGVNQRVHEEGNLGKAMSCPFCRELPPDGIITPLKKLVKMGNSGAMVSLAWATLNGDGVARDQKKAFELYHTAARAGSSKACIWLGDRYWRGDILVKCDLNKAKRLYSKGARLGEPMALYQLGDICFFHGDGEKALDYWKYYVASASMGFETALAKVRDEFLAQRVSKEDYLRALRSYQTAHEETKSNSRKYFEERLTANRTLDDVFDELGFEQLSTD